MPAEDAAQEILVKVITNLGNFKSRSALSTRVYRIAVNHLLDEKRKSPKRRSIMEEESRRECMKAMLLCLGNDFRLVYISRRALPATGFQVAVPFRRRRKH
jgi:DNA-directed RNA polymerase specialized sigma24 family protein